MTTNGNTAETLTLQGPIAEGEALSFAFRDESGIMADAFVIRHQGQLRAYRNQCRHQPLTLDYGDGDVFTEDKQLLLCRNHGALFEPATGRCISGPCTGASLFNLEVSEQGDTITVTLPAASTDLLE